MSDNPTSSNIKQPNINSSITEENNTPQNTNIVNQSPNSNTKPQLNISKALPNKEKPNQAESNELEQVVNKTNKQLKPVLKQRPTPNIEKDNNSISLKESKLNNNDTEANEVLIF